MTSESAVAPSWTGDGLALLGGILGALYLVSGRVVRPRVGIDVYGTIVCGACALWLLPAALLTGAALTGFSTAEWAVLAGLALGPQLLGHIGLNYAVRYLPAAIVAAVTLLEPAGAAALGGLVLDEWPSGQARLGSAVAIAGVAVATVRPRISLNAATTP
jgi:drug/metabolite transporter (DMT)-like permease